MIEILYEIFYVSKLITEFKGYYEAFLLVLQSNDLNCTLNLKLRKMEKACTHFWQINRQIFGRIFGIGRYQFFPYRSFTIFYFCSLRGLFIIDDKGTLRQITMNDLPVGRSVDETLRLVQAFQYTDKHGEVCPAGWTPGSDTIIPDPKEKMKYFENQNA